MKSAEISGADLEEEPTKFDLWLEKHFGDKLMKYVGWISGVLGVLLAIVLFMLVISAFVGAGLFRLPSTARERKVIEAGRTVESAPSAEEMQAEFIAQYGLTPRETDVLRAVACGERPLKQIADDLGISLRMVQRHLTNIYEKTDTQTRTGLTKEFMGK